MDGGKLKVCYCGDEAQLRTSWTEDNPTRRFHGCKHWTRSGGGCKFFEWFDPALPSKIKAKI
ncbi:hypothetical protein ACS0TY_029942 [Phlomoides rotata]